MTELMENSGPSKGLQDDSCSHVQSIISVLLICDHFPAYLKGLTIHFMSEVKQSIEEPRILLFTTQTPNTGDDELQKYKASINKMNAHTP